VSNSIRPVTRRMRAAAAAKQWTLQYRPLLANYDKDRRAQIIGVGAKLADLGPSPDPDAVDAIIGNTSWTSISCSVCGCDSLEHAIEMGTDGEDGDVRICEACLAEGLAKLGKAVAA